MWQFGMIWSTVPDTGDIWQDALTCGVRSTAARNRFKNEPFPTAQSSSAETGPFLGLSMHQAYPARSRYVCLDCFRQ
jgi:hypothetical protein